MKYQSSEIIIINQQIKYQLVSQSRQSLRYGNRQKHRKTIIIIIIKIKINTDTE